MIGARKKIVVAMDWTDFDRDGQSTLALNMVSRHGRTTPLLWLTAWKEELTERRNDFEDTCLARLKELLPEGCHVTILADRGFGDHKLFEYLDKLGFGYVIRFRGNIHVTDAAGERRAAADWVDKGGRARKLRGARVTASHEFPVGAVVCVHAKAMKEPWCLATSDETASAGTLIKYYAKRWTIEPNFRDIKDLRFGMGLSATRIGEPTRRDRLLLVNAFAIRATHNARRRGRGAGDGPTAQVKHVENPDALAVPPGAHALRTDPDHAGGAARAADDSFR